MKPLLSTVKPREAVALDPVRTFGTKLKRRIFARAMGRCEICTARVKGRWIAGHVLAWSLGGLTRFENGRVECLQCAELTQAIDTARAAKAEREACRTGPQKPGRKVRKLKSRGFPSADERARAKAWKEARVRG